MYYLWTNEMSRLDSWIALQRFSSGLNVSLCLGTSCTPQCVLFGRLTAGGFDSEPALDQVSFGAFSRLRGRTARLL